MPSLSVQLPGLPPVSHVLKDETITVGRMKGNTIVIEDASVSLMHARISQKNGQVFLKDLNSTNGTTINGQPIKEAKLRHLDRIGFADIEAQFLADSPAVNAPVVAERLEPVSKPMAISSMAVGTNTPKRSAFSVNSS
ncbi:MAG TPA: FHA domain-containing protein, partial [Candidatus Eisenbacteria bacterium]|nr:FHA domain-containing protein [Candidatus Eisenbacteria bacterium]